MSKIDYQALREKAEKATCGVWSLEYGEERLDAGDALIHREVVGYLPICRIEGAHPESGFDEDFQMEQQANAEFIAAASPVTVLSLLDELDKWQQESSAWQAVAEKQLALAADAEKRIAELEEGEVVPDEMTPKQASRSYCGEVRGYRDGCDACRAAMLQCADDSLAHEGKNHPEDKICMVDHFGGSNNMVEPVTDNTNQQFESLSRGDK